MQITPSNPKTTITVRTSEKPQLGQGTKWWEEKDPKKLSDQLLTAAAFLKETQSYRNRHAAIYARLYGNMSLFNFAGATATKMDQSKTLPSDRPTFNLIQSAVDTLVSRISQTRPAPVFLTDNGDYKQRNLGKKLNSFILGEFYSTKAYEKAAIVLRDALVEGTGCLKVYETAEHRVGLERVLLTELFVDMNEAMYGEPRQIYQVKLVDRAVIADAFPKFKKKIMEQAEGAWPDNAADSQKTVADQIIVVEGWHLRSGPKATDGRHTIACTAGVLFDEQWDKDKFPFVFLHYCPRLLGFWSQGLSEQLMGTQIEINSLLYTISRAIKLVGVPRVFQEVGSKVLKTSHNNDIGTIVEYRGVKPSYEVANAVPQELYAQLQRLIQYGYQQCGVSALEAGSQKPAGLDSGEALRVYDDISTDRFASLARRYDNFFVDLAYLVIDLAKDIAERDKKYSTVFPNKNGIKEIDLPHVDKLVDDAFVIQVFTQSALPRDPAGRLQKVIEMVQAGMITLQEGRRLLDYPDLDQVEKLDNAAEERIFQILDDIVERGKSGYQPPEPFMNIDLAMQLTTKYLNLYSQAKLEPEKLQLLRDFYSQCLAMKQAATPPAPAAIPPQASAAPLPQSPLVPNANPAPGVAGAGGGQPDAGGQIAPPSPAGRGQPQG